MISRAFRFGALAALLAGASISAQAADLPNRKAPPVFASSGVTWDGFYIGPHWGYGVGATKWRNPTGLYAINPPANGYNDGQLAGAQIGYNKQVGSVVAGVEANVSAGSLIGYANCGAGIFGSGDTCANRTNLIASRGL